VIIVHDCPVAQLVVVLSLQLQKIERATLKLRGRLSAVLFLLEIVVLAVLAVDLACVAEFSRDLIVVLLAIIASAMPVEYGKQ